MFLLDRRSGTLPIFNSCRCQPWFVANHPVLIWYIWRQSNAASYSLGWWPLAHGDLHALHMAPIVGQMSIRHTNHIAWQWHMSVQRYHMLPWYPQCTSLFYPHYIPMNYKVLFLVGDGGRCSNPFSLFARLLRDSPKGPLISWRFLLDMSFRDGINSCGKTTINHPPDHHFYRWYGHHFQLRVVYDIVLPTLQKMVVCGQKPWKAHWSSEESMFFTIASPCSSFSTCPGDPGGMRNFYSGLGRDYMHHFDSHRHTTAS